MANFVAHLDSVTYLTDDFFRVTLKISETQLFKCLCSKSREMINATDLLKQYNKETVLKDYFRTTEFAKLQTAIKHFCYGITVDGVDKYILKRAPIITEYIHTILSTGKELNDVDYFEIEEELLSILPVIEKYAKEVLK